MNPRAIRRRHDIDYLRVFATYLLFVFHGAMVFNVAPFYHIRNDEVSIAFFILCGFISLWHMPLFFVLAGWSVFSSVNARGGAGFIKERALRLLVPLVAGCILFGPLIKYVEMLSGFDAGFHGLRVSAELQESFREVIPSTLALAPPFNEGLAEFWPTYFTPARFSWSHLWFIAYLFTFSLLYRPLFAWLAKPDVAPKAQAKRHAETCRASIPAYWVYLPIIPLAVIQVTLRPHYPGLQTLINDWANFAFYSTCMVAGFLMARYPIFEAAIHRETKRATLIGLGSVVALLLAVFEIMTYQPAVLALSAVACWSFIVAMLGFAHSRLSKPSEKASARLSYLAEGSLPIYILHQPAIVLIGYPLIQTELGMVTKFVLLLIASVIAAQSFYHLIARYVPVLRFAFGMKPLSPGTAAVSAMATADANASEHDVADTDDPDLRPAMSLLLVIVVLASAWLWSAKADASVEPATKSATHTATEAGSATAAGTGARDGKANDPVGLWWADRGGAKVELAHCDGGKLCGTVVWLRHPFDDHGCELRDSKNPDPELRNRPVVGIEILNGLEPSEEIDRWTGGHIYDPGSGRTYSANLELEGQHLARFRGYVGMPLLGRTVTWVRVGHENGSCSN